MALQEKTASSQHTGRFATLTYSKTPTGEFVTGRGPSDMSREELLKLTSEAHALVFKLTGCNCLSGRISYVVEDNFADVITVPFEAAARTAQG